MTESVNVDDIGILLLYKISGGIVRDEQTAIELMKFHFRSLYGPKRLAEYDGFTATADEKNWTICAKHSGNGVKAIFIIAKADAKVVYINVARSIQDAFDGIR